MYKSKNGYFKYYNAEGKSLRIKMNVKGIKFKEPTQIHLKFKSKTDERWMHTIPRKKFNSIYEIIKYLCSNTTNKDRVFNVIVLRDDDS